MNQKKLRDTHRTPRHLAPANSLRDMAEVNQTSRRAAGELYFLSSSFFSSFFSSSSFSVAAQFFPTFQRRTRCCFNSIQASQRHGQGRLRHLRLELLLLRGE